MRNHIRCAVLFLFCFFLFQAYSFDKVSRGLYFRSFEVDQDKRTGINLTPESKIVTPDGFKLKFDIKLRRNSNDYGYVFRLVGNDSVNIDLIAHLTTQDYLSNYAFSLVSGANSLIKVRNSEIRNFQKDIWLSVVLNYDNKNNKIIFSINGVTKSAKFVTDKLSSFNLYFGYNNNPIVATTDVPPMTIRDIQIFDDNDKLKRFWKLEKHAVNNVYDECQNKKAVAVNPIWEIDNHSKWQQRAHLVVPFELPQITFNKQKGKIYIVKHKSIYVYDAVGQNVDSLYAKKGEAYNCSANQLFYESNNNKLISYNFDNANLAVFDFKTLEWTNENTDKITPQFWHHSKYYDEKDSTFLTLGGYGYHKYKSDVMQYSLKNKEWKQHDISNSITPRYLGSLGYLGNNELLYFGGYGSKTGNQVEFPHNYYDLYKINSKTLEVKKLWEMASPVDHFTNSNSLVVNNEKKSFYNLSYSNIKYNTSLKLIEYSIDKPEFKIVGDTIPYKFKDIESYCDLYYSPQTSELLAVTSVSKNNKSEVNIYSIAYPPLCSEDVLQVEEVQANWKWFLLLLIPVFAIPALYFYKKKKQKKELVRKNVNAYLNFDYDISKVQLKPSSINLLGVFQLIDKDGVNITGNFTATTSQMLILIVLYTIKNGQGISTQELTEILWPDKDTDSARNNRNVYMSKLRLLIKNFGDIELINQNNYWSAIMGKEFFCDYKNVLYLIDQIKNKQSVSESLLNELLNIASNGVLLPNLQEEWVDSFKADYTSLVIETITTLLEKKEILSDPILVLRMADVILKHDNIDEEIVKLKVKTLFDLGKKSQAKQCFDKFTDDYKNFMGVAFKGTFENFRE